MSDQVTIIEDIIREVKLIELGRPETYWQSLAEIRMQQWRLQTFERLGYTIVCSVEYLIVTSDHRQCLSVFMIPSKSRVEENPDIMSQHDFMVDEIPITRYANHLDYLSKFGSFNWFRCYLEPKPIFEGEEYDVLRVEYWFASEMQVGGGARLTFDELADGGQNFEFVFKKTL